MSLFSFPSKRRENKKSAGKERGFVPRLEPLESRDLLSTFLVINTSSDPNTSGSLPWAVQQANSTPELNFINFNIPGSGIHTININSALSLKNQVVIDGTSQPGFNGTPLISVQGNANVSDLFDLSPNSSDSTIMGLDMYDYTSDAVVVTSGGNFIQNNWIGFFRDPTTGQVSLNYNLGQSNSSGGIFVSDNTPEGIGTGSNNNVIRNNVIDGTASSGIAVLGFGGSGGLINVLPSVNNSIVDNFIGTDPSGTTAVGYGNRGDGIFLGQACQNSRITGNVISGNTDNGIEMSLPNSFVGDVIPGNNVVSGNKIGTDVSGSFAIPNGTGITIFGPAANSTIEGNVISGNLNVGISLGLAGWGPGNSNSIQGNTISLNGQYGVQLLEGSKNNYIGQNTFGTNGLGSVYVDPSAVGNYIGYTPQPTPSSFSAQIQQLFGYYPQMVQAVQTGNVSAFVQALENYVTLYATVELEIIHLLLRI
jgi:hypothetical protein